MSTNHPFNNRSEGKETYFTPPPIVKPLGLFNLDPCTHVDRPWDTAEEHMTIEDDGLLLPWFGRVWMNPPYGKALGDWMNKLALHNNGTALIFARTETAAFHDYVFPYADSILYVKGRITFYDINGDLLPNNSGAPSVLIGYGENNSDAIAESGLIGHHEYLKGGLIVIGLSREADKTWKVVVGEAMTELDGKASVNEVYEAVIELAPRKVQNNKNYKAKVRQTLQRHFENVSRGEWMN